MKVHKRYGSEQWPSSGGRFRTSVQCSTLAMWVNITTRDWDKTTCKNCLKLRPQAKGK